MIGAETTDIIDWEIKWGLAWGTTKAELAPGVTFRSMGKPVPVTAKAQQ